ncbi:hypothetical protein DdX_14667 [Ditylenchus destructor]|uniref:Uncharacterized protein n=1 Tax=Ditylenchus destructor TaxID=166010 RepID=A0AAD4MRI1_9BILA|nr:hypothetical protein DdX_14667 [Ditylenchus destructor]
MMLSYLLIAALLPAVVLSAGLLSTIASCIGINCGGKGSEESAPDANPGGHHMEEYKPHMHPGSRGKGSQAPAPDANPEVPIHHKKEQNPYMQIADEIGDLWTKLFKLRLIYDSEEFASDCKDRRVAEKFQYLADKITIYYNHSDYDRLDMHEKARVAMNAIYSLKTKYDDSKIAADLEEMDGKSQALLDKVAALPVPKGKGSPMPTLDANPESHHKKEQNPYMQIADEIGDLWTKLFKVRLINDSSFSRSFREKEIAVKVQDLANEITGYYNDVHSDEMFRKARNVHRAIHSLELEYGSDTKIAAEMKIIGDMSHAIKTKVTALPSPKSAKNGKQ